MPMVSITTKNNKAATNPFILTIQTIKTKVRHKLFSNIFPPFNIYLFHSNNIVN